jgi:hypothetical protein
MEKPRYWLCPAEYFLNFPDKKDISIYLELRLDSP